MYVKIEVMNNSFSLLVECSTTSDSTEGTPTTSAIPDTNTTVVTDGTRQAQNIPIGD